MRGLVNVIQQYLKKGAQIYVEGQMTTRKWKDEQSGQDKYSTEIVLQGYNSTSNNAWWWKYWRRWWYSK